MNLSKRDRDKSIYEMRKTGTLLKEIAHKFDMSVPQISKIVKKQEAFEKFDKEWNDPKNIHKSTIFTESHEIKIEMRFLPLLKFKS